MTIQYAYYDDEDARQFYCKKCGAVLVTDNHTAASVCCFCGSSVTLGERIAGDYAPAKIIPFSISEKDAKKAFRKWCRKLWFAPKEFSKEKRIKEAVGIYVPFWNYDLHTHGSAALDCAKNHIKEKGEDIPAETEHFEEHRQVDLAFQNVTLYASDKIPDKLLDALEPFDFSAGKAFDSSSLAGFLSEKYRLTDKELLPRVTKKAEKYMDEAVLETVTDYEAVTFTKRDYHVEQLSSEYILVPVWMVFYDHHDEEYIFALNGQTGKLAANPPRSLTKIAASTGLLTILFFLIFRLITILLGGPLL